MVFNSPREANSVQISVWANKYAYYKKRERIFVPRSGDLQYCLIGTAVFQGAKGMENKSVVEYALRIF